MEQRTEEENEEEVKESCAIPSAVTEPHWDLHMCNYKCGEKKASSSLWLLCQMEEEQRTRSTCPKRVTM